MLTYALAVMSLCLLLAAFAMRKIAFHCIKQTKKVETNEAREKEGYVYYVDVDRSVGPTSTTCVAWRV